jgi:hypothetical protein
VVLCAATQGVPAAAYTSQGPSGRAGGPVRTACPLEEAATGQSSAAISNTLGRIAASMEPPSCLPAILPAIRSKDSFQA